MLTVVMLQEKKRFGERVDKTFEHARRVAVASSTFDGAMHMATNVALVSVLGYGGNMVLAGDLSAGQLTSFLMYSLYAGINLGSVRAAAVFAIDTGGAALWSSRAMCTDGELFLAAHACRRRQHPRVPDP